MLKFTVQTNSPQKIRIRTYNPKKKNTFYTDRWCMVNGTMNFYVRMPLSPDFVITEIYNEAKGDMPKGQDNSFALIDEKMLPLPIKPEGLAGMNRLLPEWQKFSNEFVENAGWLSTGTYYSDQGHFCIDYVDVIRNEKGQPLRTPARVHMKTGVMQISQLHFRPMPVPRRKAIVTHEYSHVYENNDMRNETEADLNGLIIYLCEGWPRIEAHTAFLDVFEKTPTDGNLKRYKILKEFIKRFDDINFAQLN